MRSPRHRRSTAALTALAALLIAAPVAEAGSGWASTGSMAATRRAHVSVPLPDGRVLAISGFAATGEVAGAELYDPRHGSWSAAAPPLVPRQYASATLLRDGRVLLTGGVSAAGVTASSELYDPVANTWTATGSLGQARNGHAAALLPDGRVLVAGGSDGARNALTSAEVYDPATGTWSPTGALTVGRETGQTALLPDGRVLFAGGFDSTLTTTFFAATEVYDPVSGAWSTVAPMSLQRAQGTAVALPGGRVLVAGGVARTGFVRDAEAFDAATGTWSPLPRPGIQGNVTLGVPLGGRRALVLADGTTTTPIFDDATGAWTPGGTTAAMRSLATLTRLPDGRILAAGGSNLATAEVFTPPTSRTATGTDLGEHPVGDRTTHDVRIRNAGDDLLRVDGATLTGRDAGDFAVAADGCTGTTVAPGGSCVVRIRFEPGAVGARSATLTFDDNAERSPATELRGVGTVPAVGPPPSVPEAPVPPVVPAAPAPPVAPVAPGPPPQPAPVPCVVRSVVLFGVEPVGGPRAPRVRLTGVASGTAAGTPVEVRRDETRIATVRVASDGTVRATVPAPRAARARARARYRLVVADGRRTRALKGERLASISGRAVRANGEVRVTGRVAGVRRSTRLTIWSTAACAGGTARVGTVRTDSRGRWSAVLPAASARQGALVYRIRQGRRTVTLPIVVRAR